MQTQVILDTRTIINLVHDPYGVCLWLENILKAEILKE